MLQAAQSRGASLAERLPPHAYFIVSALFHYLGPSFAVLLFAHVGVLGVAWLRIASAALIFALWRRPWRFMAEADRQSRVLIITLGVTLAAMNAVFYLAIARLQLATVASIEFVATIAIALIGIASWRNATALVVAVGGVFLLVGFQMTTDWLGLAFALANAVLFATYIVLGHASARHGGSSIGRLSAAMAVAAIIALPIGIGDVSAILDHPMLILAGIGVGLSSSVIPYICDQLAMARLPRATFALMLALLPATAAVVGAVVLAQWPSAKDVVGILLVAAGVAMHRPVEE